MGHFIATIPNFVFFSAMYATHSEIRLSLS